ncbi:MAG: TRAP transporter small permease subunit [Granulosicoccaceae bacterium]
MSTTENRSPATNARPSLCYVRLFGWLMLAVMSSWLFSNYLSNSHSWPRPFTELDKGFEWRLVVQLLIYAVPLAIAYAYVRNSGDTTLRMDADRVTAINAYLVRAAFFAVLFVGVADTVISFLRVEDMLKLYFDTETAKSLSRPQERGAMLHFPLIGAAFVAAAFFRSLCFPWLALLIVVAELGIVISRFIFSYEQAFMGDLVRFWYAALFLFASAYTLLQEGHVRVDVFYAGMSKRRKGAVNAIGALLLGMTLCWTILILGLGSKTSIIYAPLANVEVSQSGFGLYTKYLMAGFLAVFAITMLIQFVSQLFEAVADYRKEPGAREIDAAAAH